MFVIYGGQYIWYSMQVALKRNRQIPVGYTKKSMTCS